MKQAAFIYFIIFYFSLVLVACKSKQPLEPVRIETVKTVTNTVRDTVITTKADSTFYYAYVDCINGKPIIREPQNSHGNPFNISQQEKQKNGADKKGLQNPKVSLSDNILQVGCYQLAEQLHLKWKETFIKEFKSTYQPTYIEKPLKWWQKTLMWIGGIFLLLSAIGITLKLTLKI